MNNTFLLSFAVGLIGAIGALALASGLVGLALAKHRAWARPLLLCATSAGLLGVLALFAVASLTDTNPAGVAAGIAFLCGAGIAALAWSLLRRIMRAETPRS
ncbi:MAG: hypothetical protein HYZ17_15990 [Betaproteobacteria bacterium]|nr:hypothetical protein [Betaproteobacteria bacterium]